MKNLAYDKKAILAIVAITLFFIAAALFGSLFSDKLTFASNSYGKVVYVFLTIISIIFVPLSTFPLIPIASNLWGWFETGILSIIGWMVGSQIIFIISRRFGKPLIKKIISLDKIELWENALPERKSFWSVVLLRIILPVDILSYALGLFSKIDSTKYFWATLIGITPFAFLFSYTGETLFQPNIFTIISVVLIVIIYIYFWKFYKKKGE